MARKWRLSYSAVPMFEGAQASGAVVNFTDISEKRQMEIELRLAQKLEAVGSLAAGIAHEINTPIQFIGDNTRFRAGFLPRQVLRMITKYEEIHQQARNGAVHGQHLDDLDELCKKIEWTFLKAEIPKALEQMLDGVNRVATIVRAMKEFSHVDRSADKVAADLNKAIESTLIVSRNETKYVADVETDLGALPPVSCHLGDLNQVFLNLFVNAAHAIGDVMNVTGQKGPHHRPEPPGWRLRRRHRPGHRYGSPLEFAAKYSTRFSPPRKSARVPARDWLSRVPSLSKNMAARLRLKRKWGRAPRFVCACR